MIAGGLRDLLRSRGESIDGIMLPIYGPVSLRRDRPGHEGGNLITEMIVHLPLGTADPRARLAQVARETRRKALARPSLGTMFGSRLVRGAMLKLVVRQRINVVSADLPGPQHPLYFTGRSCSSCSRCSTCSGTSPWAWGRCPTQASSTSWRSPTPTPTPDLDVLAAGMQAALAALAEPRGPESNRRGRQSLEGVRAVDALVATVAQ